MEQNYVEMKMTILMTSDVHGYILPYSYVDGSSTNHGLSLLSNLIHTQRQQGNEILLIDNGDFLQGSPLTYYEAKVDTSGRSTVIDCMNMIGYDACVPGNHEFNFGKKYMNNAVQSSAFPWLAANVLSAATGEPYLGTPYRIWEWSNGVRVALLGLTTKYVPHWEHPDHIEGIMFSDPVEAARQWVPYLREEEHADIVIVAYHGGLERDLTSGEASEPLTGENQGYALCTEVPGIDVLLTGHQHRLIAGVDVAGVRVIQCGSEGKTIGRVTLTLEHQGGKWHVANKQSDLHSAEDAVSNSELDSRIRALCAPSERKLQAWLDQAMGTVKGEDMRIVDPFLTRLEEHPFIEWINQVQMEIGGADISCTALFDNTAPGFGPVITMRDIITNYKYPNTLRVLRLQGRDIKAALEKSAQYFHLNEFGEIEVSSDFLEPKTQHYNYDMWEGIDYTIDVSRPRGERIIRLQREGTPIHPDQEFNVVMNNYRASGGGEYSMFIDKPVIKDIPVDMTQLLADYILNKETIISSVNHNWRVIIGTS